MRRALSAFLLISLSIMPLAAQAGQWYLDKPITDIRFEGLSSVSENELLGLVRPFLGKPYTDALSWDIQSKLYALDYFDLIVPDIRRAGGSTDGVILVFEVEEKALVDELLFSGNNKVRRGELLDAVLVKKGDMLNPGALRLDEQAIIDLYLEKGFIAATVKTDFSVDEKTNRARVVFNIQEGNQTKISDIRFVGNDKHVSDNTLRNMMKTKPQSLFNKGLFVETKLQEDLKTIERYYGDQGFIDAAILDVNKEIIFDEDENLNKMVITIVIREGESWTYAGMSFSGNKIYSDADLQEQVLQRPGQTFSLSKFQLDYQRVTDLYFENGYIFNTFTYEENRDEDRREISYAVQVTERDRAHIENIIIRGNEKTKSYVIRREIPLEEGEVFSKTKILDGMLNLYNLQYFDVVEPQPYPGSTDGLMDLIVDVSEGKTSDIGFGLTFSGGPDFPISGQITWNDRNFLGRGQNLGAEISVSPDVQKASLKFTEPRLLGRRWSGGVDLTYSHQVNRYISQDLLPINGIPDPYNTWEEYEDAGSVVPEDFQMEYMSHYISTGFSTGYVWPTRLGRLGLSTSLRFSWEYAIYDDDIYRPLSQDIRDNLFTWQYFDSISLRLSWDTRDLQYDPTKGFVLSQNFTFAGLLPASHKDYVKSITRFNYNLTLFDIPVGDKEKSFKSIMSFNSAFQGLLNKPWTDVIADPQVDGFYIDGMFVARGWQPESGLKYLWDNTLQLKFPIFPNILSFDLFLDGVGGWTGTRSSSTGSDALLDMKIDDWRFSIGGGLRFANPQFPIGLYLVKKFQWDANGKVNWNPEPDFTEFNNLGLDLVIAFSLDIY